MSPLSRYTRTSLLLLVLMCAAFGANLTEKQRSRLHPLFQSLITNSSSPLSKTSGKLHRITSTVSSDGTLRYGAIVYTHDIEILRSMGIHINSVLPDFVTAQLTVSDLTRLASLESVKFLDPGKIHKPLLDVSVPETGALRLHSGVINNTPYKGAGAIVLMYDTGIDWKHFDFRKAGDTTQSRILFIWDQTLTPSGNETSPVGFTYGVEYTKAQIDNELNGTKRGVVREKDIAGHGTHVASTAAGNGQAFNNKYIGMAPEADIIVVKGGDGSFSSIREIEGLDYAQIKAAALGKPVVVNMSLGGQLGSHDGTNDDEVAVNNFVQYNGRVVCIAAGNDGDNKIHTNGTVSNGSPAAFQVNVPTYSAADIGMDNNYFIIDMWLPNSNAVSLTITSPSNTTYSTPADSSIDGLNRPDGTIDTWNHTETPYNHRHLQVWIHDATTIVPIPGLWTIKLTTSGSSVAYDGWIDSDLSGSYATFPNGNTNKTVAMPGTANGAITVGSYVTKWSWTDYRGISWLYDNTPDRTGNISTFSSTGPTADNRQKPDIAAPGQVIVAAFSSNDVTESSSDIIVNNKYLLMQGTSMATPHVTGGVALLLGAKPTLTAAQIKNYIINAARTDSLTSTVWNSSWGFGKLDIFKAMSTVTAVERVSAELPISYILNQNYPNPFNPTTKIEYSIPVKGLVKLQIFDILGRSVASLVDEVQDAGVYHSTWTGKTGNGIAVSSGVYFYRLQSGAFSKTERMLLLK
jgi:minor extracellular serine protease Vpr